MSQYIAALMRGMPVKTDLPLMAYGMEGTCKINPFCAFPRRFHAMSEADGAGTLARTRYETANYLKFTALLKPVVTYQFLRTEAFQSFRELGNCFTVAFVIDKALVRARSCKRAARSRIPRLRLGGCPGPRCTAARRRHDHRAHGTAHRPAVWMGKYVSAFA